MLVNGKEVFTDDYELTALQAYNVQQKINSAPELDDSNKSDAIVSSGSVESSQRSVSNSSTYNYSIGMFETLGSTTSRRTTRTREQLYETYIRMSSMGLVKRALDTIADEASQSNDDNNVITVNSNNEKIYNCLENLFFDKLSINTELWSMIVETLKMGDNFYEVSLEVKDGMATGIKRLKYLDPSKVEVHEKDGRIDYYVYKSQSKSKNMSLEQRLFPWQIIHFKIEDKETKPYGKSLLYAGIRSYERLTATEDIFLTYTISRTPSRRVFKIDVGGLPQLEAQRAIREMRDSYRSQSVIDSDGNLNQISSILSITSDIFIPVREGSGGTTIETLQGDSMNMNQNMIFLQNFKNDLVASFNIPAEYLGMETASDAKSTTLSQKDIKFGRFVERIQQQLLKPLYKIASIELFFNGFKGDDLKDFTIELTPPSTTKEITENGLLSEKINLMQTMQSLGVFPTNWLLKKVLKLSDKEIAEIQFMKMVETKTQQLADQQAQMGMPGALPPAGGAPDFGGEAPAEVGNETPPEMEVPAEGGGEGNEIPVPENGGEEGLETQSVSFFNVNGQKFLIEDKNDFIEVVKFVKNQNKNRNSRPSTFMEDVNDYGERKPQVKASNPFFFLNEGNEFGGLDIRKGTNFKRYSGNVIREEVTRN